MPQIHLDPLCLVKVTFSGDNGPQQITTMNLRSLLKIVSEIPIDHDAGLVFVMTQEDGSRIICPVVSYVVGGPTLMLLDIGTTLATVDEANAQRSGQ